MSAQCAAAGPAAREASSSAVAAVGRGSAPVGVRTRGVVHNAGMARDVLTAQQLITDLQRLGVAAGAAVMVHASLRAVGPVEGDAAGIVGALDAAVGPNGTLLMNPGARDEWAW